MFVRTNLFVAVNPTALTIVTD